MTAKEEIDRETTRRAEALYYRLFRDAFGRAIVSRADDLRAIERIFSPVIFSVAEYVVMANDSSHQPATELPESATSCASGLLSMLSRSRSVWSEDRADSQAWNWLHACIENLKDAVRS